MTTAVLVIDMLRGFLEKGYPLYCGDLARNIIPNVKRRLEQELSQGSRVFFICDNHTPDDLEFEMFPPHCIAGTGEAEVIPELAAIPGEIIPKNRFSGFFESVLEGKLKELAPEKLIVCGVCTNICVLHTVADARNRGYTVEVPTDCVASMDQQAHRFALDHMERILGAKLIPPTPLEIPRPHFTVAESVLSGETTDIYFVRTKEILKREGLNPVATMEVFPRSEGILCGMHEVLDLLSRVLTGQESRVKSQESRVEGRGIPDSRLQTSDPIEVWALSEGDSFQKKEVVLRITAPYQSYAIYETVYLGILAHCSGWATAARECVQAAQGIPVISFGARHVHPSVVGVMEYAAIVGGCGGCASTAGAKLAGQEPMGTMPHALIIVMGDTARATLAFDKHMPPEVPRIALVDTFRDEPEESIIVARAMGGRLQGIRLDTPSERGRVTADLVKETRARLDLAGFKDVRIYVSGGIDPERIRYFLDSGAPVDTFAVGSYISDTRPINFTADLHEVEGKPIAKRGRIPGITPNPRLKRVL
ncbi:MAG: Nicotinate phosphoribosyltransferase pncB2 [Dehalococcoidia bacterium]|nr:Nicotinate phosphoribosyltransferase pncB2 [Chloroflexota bacterium]